MMFESAPMGPRTPAVTSAVKRYIAIAIAAFMVCAGAGVLITALSPAKPVATTKLTLDDPRGNSVFRSSNLPPADLATYTTGRAAYAHSVPVLDRATQLLGSKHSERWLADRVKTSIGASSDI